jgi:hypothetical protein
VLDTRLKILLCKKKYCAKSKEVKTGCKLAEYFKEGRGSKRVDLAVVMMMIRGIMRNLQLNP